MLPWVVAIGLTGFYLNHPDPILNMLEGEETDDANFPLIGNAKIVDADYVVNFAKKMWPGDEIGSLTEEIYHGQPSLVAKTQARELIAEKPSGYVFEKIGYWRNLYDPEGQLIQSKIYWGRAFKDFHVRGWLGKTFGTVMADLTSLCLVVFGLSGMYIFFFPRVKRAAARLKRPSA